MEGSFIGRGETRAKKILEGLFHEKAHVKSQVPIHQVIRKDEFDVLGKEHNQHKFDLAVLFNCGMGHLIRSDIILEVNFKHKIGAARKWLNVYAPDLRKAGKIPVAINDFECESLFDTDKPRPLRWADYIDVINALKIARVEP